MSSSRVCLRTRSSIRHSAAVDILSKDGYHVSVVQEPLTSLAGDVAATQRVIEQQNGPVILVGHSYGGTVITVAGAEPKVRDANAREPG